MRLSVSRPPYVIPSYSLTGDLLAYLKCGLQYRYHNRGALPPSKPVQLWFGEFIHGVLEEAFSYWARNDARRPWPWDWAADIRPLELQVHRRLLARGLHPPFGLFCPYSSSNSMCTCRGNDHHKLIASRRVEAAINTWGQHLFPVITEAEVRLRGIRPMPSVPERPRADYYEIAGIVDVLGWLKLQELPHNRISRLVSQEVDGHVLAAGAYEIIVDYKGTRRPTTHTPLWDHYAWQVLTYAWLRAQQPKSAPVVAGVLIFVNELEPSVEEFEELKQDVKTGATDVMPSGADKRAIEQWRPGQPLPELTPEFRAQRSVRIIPVNDTTVGQSLNLFDSVVADIERSVLQEMKGTGIVASWSRRPSGHPYVAPEERTCTVCDFKHFCQLARKLGYGAAPKAP